MNLVFASGFLVPQSLLGKDYFRDLPGKYPDALFAKVSILGSIANRAAELAAAIAAKFRAGDIHIIAHSMGGLDARYLLARNLNNMAGRVASLSTISTPHWGSPVADLVTGQAGPGLLTAVAEAGMAGLFAAIPDLENKAGALSELTTASAKQFNHNFPATAGVAYYSYAGKGPGTIALNLAGDFFRLRGGTEQEKDNDGVVSVASATWPRALAEQPWSADHFGEIGYNLNTPDFKTPFPYVEAINRVVARAVASPPRSQP